MAINKYNAASRNVMPVAAYQPIGASDWGVFAPGQQQGGTAFANGNLTNVGSGGSLNNGSFFAKITWVTAFGETLPSAEGTVTVTGGPSGSVTIALGSVGPLNTGSQLNAAPIIGWNIYTSSTTNTELLNNAAAGLSVTLSSQTVVNNGVTSTITFIPIATTSATVKVLGAGQALPTVNTSGLNNLSLPNIAASTSVDVDVFVSPTFMQQRLTTFKRPAGVTDAAGFSVDACDCIAPLWAASTSFSLNNYIVINSNVFQVTVAGTSASLANFPAAFATSVKGGNVTDNTVTWANRGKGRIVRMRFSNGTGTAGQPVAMEYDLMQF